MRVCEIKTSPPQEWKVDTDNGTFEGFAAAYGNVDQGKDRLMFGSGAHIAESNPLLPVYFGHGWVQNERPVGKSLYFEEREAGLFTKAKLFDTPSGVEVLTGMREGVLGALSIGWKALEKRMVKEGKERIREVTKYDLMEYSVLPNGMAMNDNALVTSVKGILQIVEGKDRYIGGITGIADVGGSASWESIQDAVEDEVEKLHPTNVDVYVRDISATAVVYEVNDWSTDTSETFQVGYTIDAEGNVTLSGDPAPVEIHVSYEPAAGDGKAKVDLTGENIPAKDYRELRGFVEKADPIALLLDEATYLNELTKSLKAEGREEEVRLALAELDSAALVLKGLCAVEAIDLPEEGDILALVRQTTQNIREASQTLTSV